MENLEGIIEFGKLIAMVVPISLAGNFGLWAVMQTGARISSKIYKYNLYREALKEYQGKRQQLQLFSPEYSDFRGFVDFGK